MNYVLGEIMIKFLLLECDLENKPELEALDFISEYPKYYKEVMDSISTNSEYSLIITKPIAYQWFTNMATRYPQGAFIFDTIDARKALAEKWRLALPEDLTNEEIAYSGLLDLDVQSQPGQSFSDILLSHFYSPYLSAKTFPFTQIPSFFETIDIERWLTNRADPLLARTLHQRMELWKQEARTIEQRRLIELFAADPQSLKKHLMAFRVLQHYPILGEMLLDENFSLFKVLKLSLNDLEVNEEVIPETILQVTYHLNEHDPQTPQEVGALIVQVSGLLWVEFETIEQYLLAHQEWISTDILDQLENKFESLTFRTSRRIKTLRGMIRPPMPNAPEVNWDFDQMISWATESYLPYQAWCSSQEQFELELYQIGDQFSEWLIANWNDLHANSKRMVFNILPNITPILKSPDIVNLVVVVDNLGWSFYEVLVTQFQEEGYYITAADPYLAMLPTETEISKKCLLSGEVGYSRIDKKTYKDMLEKGWVPYFNDSTIRYLSDLGNLKEVDIIDANTYVVNYLAVDRALHQSAGEIGFSHREHVPRLLEKVVENVIEFIDKHELQEKIRIHIVSDHGSTQIPAHIPNDLDPAFFKVPGFTARSHRYLEVSDDKFATLADNLKVDCYFLSKNEFLLPANMLCARRGNRFIATDHRTYVHGGLLPEEVIVPYLAFEPVSVPLEELTITMPKNKFRYRLEPIVLEVGNPNDVLVEKVQVSVLNSNVESDLFSIAAIKGKSKATIELQARFKQTSLPEEQANLRLRIRYHSRGEKHMQDMTKEIVMIKMVEEKSTSIFDKLE